MGKITIECEVGSVSDGYHTFNELYEHRCRLFIALAASHPELSWKARTHEDGSKFDGWFVAGMNLPTGPITYHLPDRMWDDMRDVPSLLKAPEWDGHTAQDVLERLEKWEAPAAGTTGA